MDLLYIGLTIVFFALTALLIFGFERLRRPQ